MKEVPDIDRIAALVGDPARANLLVALMSGKALTVRELSEEAGMTPRNTSLHLAKLDEGGLLEQRKQGRHKYFSLANGDVIHLLESILGLAAGSGRLRIRTGPRNEALRKARVCYNHLAGHMGVRMYDSLVRQGCMRLGGNGIELTEAGAMCVNDFGVDLASLRRKQSPLCRDCLDWSERRSHLAGNLGRALLSRMEDLGWTERVPSTRILRFTEDGKGRFDAMFSA